MKRIALLLALVPFALAEGDAPETGVKVDDVAKEIIAKWQAKEYRLAAAGVTKCSYKIQASVTQGPQQMETTGSFKWDGEKGSLEWSNPQVGAMLSQQGWGTEQLSQGFQKDFFAQMAGDGATITGKKTEDGAVLDIKGGKDQLKRVVLDANGLPKTMVMSFPLPTGQKTNTNFHVSYTKVGDKYMMTGYHFAFVMPQTGTYSEKTTMSVEKIGEYYVVTSAHADGAMDMGQMGKHASVKKLTFTDYKFNGDVE